MLKRLPPYSGIMASTRVTRAPASTRRSARFEPMNPRPPVIRTRAPALEGPQVVAGQPPALLVVGVQVGEVDAQQGRLQFVEPAVHAALGVVLAVGLAVVPQAADALRQAGVGGEDGPGVAQSPQVL